MFRTLRALRFTSALLALALIPSACGFTSVAFTPAERGGQKIGLVFLLICGLALHVAIAIRRRRQAPQLAPAVADPGSGPQSSSGPKADPE